MDARRVPVGIDEAALRGDLAAIAAQGWVVVRDLLSAEQLAEIRRALEPHLQERLLGRNEFEGHRTERVYALVGRGRVFEDLAEHPRVLAICDALLAPNYLLTASQAIHIRPGETAQPLHTDDSFYPVPRPRAAISISTIVAVDDFTAENGATQIVPGSHRWADAEVGNLLAHVDFTTRPLAERLAGPAPSAAAPRAPGAAAPAYELVDVLMPAGSAIVFLGTLVHRGGANRSARPRLALSNQYCEPWARQQENFFLAVPRERAARMSERLQALLGYSIHPPFMGHANGVHPRRSLAGG